MQVLSSPIHTIFLPFPCTLHTYEHSRSIIARHLHNRLWCAGGSAAAVFDVTCTSAAVSTCVVSHGFSNGRSSGGIIAASDESSTLATTSSASLTCGCVIFCSSSGANPCTSCQSSASCSCSSTYSAMSCSSCAAADDEPFVPPLPLPSDMPSSTMPIASSLSRSCVLQWPVRRLYRCSKTTSAGTSSAPSTVAAIAPIS